MREETLRQLMAKLGMANTQRRHIRAKDTTWLNHSCPFAPYLHKSGSDKNPSFGILVNDSGTSVFKCLGCKQTGSTNKLIRLLAKYRNMDYSALLSEAEEGEKGVRRFKPFDEDFVREPEELVALEEAMWDGLFDPIGDHAEAGRFMVKRRVLRETCDKLGLTFDPEKRRIVFPVKGRNGELWGFSGRTVIPGHEPKVLDYGGLPKYAVIMGMERWREGFPKLIVEGLIAYGRMHEIGLEQYVDIGALLGSEMTEEKAQLLRLEGETVIFLLDPDDAGTAGTFGRWDEIDERYMIEHSAIGKLWGHVPILAPEFPFEEMLEEGIEPDVDNLTLEQVLGMLSCRSWKPDDEQAEYLRRAHKGWSGLENR